MAEQSRSLVVGVFPDRGKAERAVDELWHTGWSKDEIGLAAPGEPVRQAETGTGRMEDKAASGAATGAVAGGVVGALAGAAAALTVPPLAPVVAGGAAAGVAAVVAGGAAAGAAAGAYLGPFVALGLAEDEARRYEQEVTAGRAVVVVRADGGREDKAIKVLSSHGASEVRTGPAAVPR